MRIGIFGGSFDPVHWGHLRLAESCWRHARLNRVDFVPAAQQPHKPGGPTASPEDRVAMLELAVIGRPEFAVSTVELDRGGISYTADTLRALHEQQPGDQFYFLMGADSLADLPNWRDPAAICELATPLVVHRPGSAEPDFDALRPFVSAERLAEIRAAQIEAPPTPISSSQIRELIASGGAWQSLLPAQVADYITRRRLYQSEPVR
jgi:nicotinate-nucleotide adenylyltransferase